MTATNAASNAEPVESLDEPILIDDADFMRTVSRLKELRAFFLREAIKLDKEDSLGKLNRMQSPRISSSIVHTRAPTQEEWDLAENITQQMYGHLTDKLRRKFVAGDIPRWLPISPLVLLFLLYSLSYSRSALLRFTTRHLHWC